MNSNKCPCAIPLGFIQLSGGICFRYTGAKRGVSTIGGYSGTSLYIIKQSSILTRGCAAGCRDIVTFNEMDLISSSTRVHTTVRGFILGCYPGRDRRGHGGTVRSR